MLLSVIIPCYNEVNTIEQIIDAVNQAKQYSVEIIVVDDASVDGTRHILEAKIEPLGLAHKVIYHPINLGKGAAVRSGLSVATGDVVIIQDADLEYDPADYGRLLEAFDDGRTQVVYGSRALKAENPRSYQS